MTDVAANLAAARARIDAACARAGRDPGSVELLPVSKTHPIELIRVAHALRDHTRKVDVVSRWGGEEFMVIAPSTGAEEAARLADKLRSAIERMDIPGVGSKTCSFGVAAYERGDAPTTLVSRADAALYAAKAAGRNRVESGTRDAQGPG